MLRRREFLSLPAAALQPPRKLKAAFLGASHPHAPNKLKFVAQSPDFELAGVAEDDPTVRAALGPYPWLSTQQILDDPSIQVVFIESEVARHAPLAIMALQAGKHCHIEKPAAVSVAAMREIANLARSRRRIIQAGYMWRYNPAVSAALEAARSGWLGDVYMIHGRMNVLSPPAQRAEFSAFPGGQMFDLGAHLIDIVVRLLGRPNRITPFLRHHSNIPDQLKDNAAVVLEYPRTLAILTSATLQPNATSHRTLEIFGSNGNAVIRPIEPPTLEIDLAQPAGPYPAGRHKPPMPPYERYRRDIAALAAAIRGEHPLETTPDTELAVTEVLLTASAMIGN